MIFLIVKGIEYHHKWQERLIPGESFSFEGGPVGSNTPALFFYLYFFMTGLHAVHVLVGVAVLGTLLCRASAFSIPSRSTLEVSGLYWHFVDIIWIYLFPLLYLI